MAICHWRMEIHPWKVFISASPSKKNTGMQNIWSFLFISLSFLGDKLFLSVLMPSKYSMRILVL